MFKYISAIYSLFWSLKGKGALYRLMKIILPSFSAKYLVSEIKFQMKHFNIYSLHNVCAIIHIQIILLCNTNHIDAVL